MLKISPNIILDISRDGMNGFITLVQDEGNSVLERKSQGDLKYNQIHIEKIINQVKDIIKVGLKEDELKRLLQNEYYGERTCIAKGIEPINGKDGYVKYHFDVEKS